MKRHENDDKPGNLTCLLTCQNRSPYKQHGFTLLELLVVVVIVAILFTYTTLAIRSDSPEDLIEKEAVRLEHRIKLALEEATLRGEEYAIEIQQNGYRFLHFVENQWQPLSDDKILQARELPLQMELEMSLEDTEIVIEPGAKKSASKTDEIESIDDDTQNSQDTKKVTYKPQIFLLSSGEITPEFEIRIYLLGIEASYIVTGLFDGSVTSQQSEL